ncbi:hypothetical protein R3F64_09450 [Halomonas sp. 5021]|uniref:hypothetical protein n=1 Tax=Halomonas sp. 5021 TaxID=3082156 RepID=UPI002FC90F90
MRRIGDRYQYDHPSQKEPYHWLTYLAMLFVAFALAVTMPFPWNPWITFWAILVIGAVERLVLRGKSQ